MPLWVPLLHRREAPLLEHLVLTIGNTALGQVTKLVRWRDADASAKIPAPKQQTFFKATVNPSQREQVVEISVGQGADCGAAAGEPFGDTPGRRRSRARKTLSECWWAPRCRRRRGGVYLAEPPFQEAPIHRTPQRHQRMLHVDDLIEPSRAVPVAASRPPPKRSRARESRIKFARNLEGSVRSRSREGSASACHATSLKPD
jgi:hypothetical protein